MLKDLIQIYECARMVVLIDAATCDEGFFLMFNCVDVLQQQDLDITVSVFVHHVCG